MAAQNIDYVELYTDDKQSAVDYFTRALGFARVARSDDHGKHSVLVRQADVRLVITDGPATEEFIECHGAGIADIALACDDPGATRDSAVAAGATPAGRPDQPAVSGFGAVRHTLLPAAPAGGGRLPPGRAWLPAAGPAAAGPWIRSLDHVAVCLPGGTLEDSAGFYTAGFGLARYSGEYTELGDQAMKSIVVRSPSGAITYTLLEPDQTRSPGQLDAFLKRNDGPGVQHLAFGVTDVVAAVSQFKSRGVEFLGAPDTYYDMLAERLPDVRADIARLRSSSVLLDHDEWGYLLQLFTRSPYPRNTLFYELIQRRGARGFGSRNIRALYEAVERDRITAG